MNLLGLVAYTIRMEDNKKVFKFHARPGEDLEQWSAPTEAALEAHQVLHVLTVNVAGKVTADNPLGDEATLQVAKAREIIMQGLEAKPLRMCLNDRDNPFEMWHRLRQRHAVSNLMTKAQLQMKLNRLRYTDQPMSDFVDKLEEIFNRLQGMESPYPEEMQVAILLSVFGEKSKSSYGAIVAALQTTSGGLTWENVTARLLQEYEEKQWNKSREVTPAASKTGHALSSFTRRGSKPWNYSKKGVMEKRICHFCGEIGHFIRKYPRIKPVHRHLGGNDRQEPPRPRYVAAKSTVL